MTQKEIKQVAAKAEADFQTLVPPVGKPYPPVEVCTNNTFEEKIDKITDRIDADPIFLDEYTGPVKLIHGNKGDAIIVRNTRDLSELRLRMQYLRELGKFFLLATEGEEFSDYAAELYELPYEEEDLPEPFVDNEELSQSGWGKPIFSNHSGISDDEEDETSDDDEEDFLGHLGYTFWHEFASQVLVNKVMERFDPPSHPQPDSTLEMAQYVLNEGISGEGEYGIVAENCFGLYFADILTNVETMAVLEGTDYGLSVLDEGTATLVQSLAETLRPIIKRDEFWKTDLAFLRKVGSLLYEIGDGNVSDDDDEDEDFDEFEDEIEGLEEYAEGLLEALGYDTDEPDDLKKALKRLEKAAPEELKGVPKADRQIFAQDRNTILAVIRAWLELEDWFD